MYLFLVEVEAVALWNSPVRNAQDTFLYSTAAMFVKSVRHFIIIII
jgi:hypothetical protein